MPYPTAEQLDQLVLEKFESCHMAMSTGAEDFMVFPTQQEILVMIKNSVNPTVSQYSSNREESKDNQELYQQHLKAFDVFLREEENKEIKGLLDGMDSHKSADNNIKLLHSLYYLSKLIDNNSPSISAEKKEAIGYYLNQNQFVKQFIQFLNNLAYSDQSILFLNQYGLGTIIPLLTDEQISRIAPCLYLEKIEPIGIDPIQLSQIKQLHHTQLNTFRFQLLSDIKQANTLEAKNSIVENGLKVLDLLKETHACLEDLSKIKSNPPKAINLVKKLQEALLFDTAPENQENSTTTERRCKQFQAVFNQHKDQLSFSTIEKIKIYLQQIIYMISFCASFIVGVPVYKKHKEAAALLVLSERGSKILNGNSFFHTTSDQQQTVQHKTKTFFSCGQGKGTQLI